MKLSENTKQQLFFLLFVIGIGILLWVATLAIPVPEHVEKPVRFDIVEKVFMHGKGDYSILVRKGSELINYDCGKARLLADVADGEPMWAEGTAVEVCYMNKKNVYCRDMKIHVHIGLIEGGSYNYRRRKKTITENTHVVE